MPSRVKSIVTHHRPHLDEIVAIYLLRRYGKGLFPGIEKAPVQFQHPSSKPFVPVDQLFDRGIIALGIWGSAFDEHPAVANGMERKENECVSTLVAKRLAIDMEPELRPLLKYVRASDLNATDSPFGIASVMTVLYDSGWEFPEVYDWVTAGIEAKIDLDPNEKSADFSLQYIAYLMRSSEGRGDGARDWFWKGLAAKADGQYHLLTETLREFQKAGKATVILGRTVVIVESDNNQMWTLVRKGHAFLGSDSSKVINADIFIQRQSNGQTMIVFSKKTMDPDSLDRMAVLLRVTEDPRFLKAHPLWEGLTKEGMLEDKRWHFFRPGFMLLNGSKTALGVAPSRLSIAKIVSIIAIAVSRKNFMEWAETKGVKAER